MNGGSRGAAGRSIAIAAIACTAHAATVWAHADPQELLRASAAEVERHRDDPQARLTHARSLQLAREWDAALSELDAAAARGGPPDDIGAMRAAILLDAGRAPAALREIDQVLKRHPDRPALVYERGRALLALGRTQEAAEDFGRAISTMPEPRPEHVIVRRDALLSIGKVAEAVAALDQGMAKIGRVPSLQLAAVDLEVQLGRYDAAIARLDDLLARGAPNPNWVARRGDILARSGNPKDARAAYARALAIIASRPGTRRAKPFDDLKRRLETELASTSERGEKE